MRRLLVHGMHGLGDNLHQRALLRQLMMTYEVWLETSWVSVYHDLIAEGLHVVQSPTRLRTQNKNQRREAALFERAPGGIEESIFIRYTREDPERTRSNTVLEAMMVRTGRGLDYTIADYRLPIADGWRAPLIPGRGWQDDKPLLIYRPLTVRPEWPGSGLRNADPAAYAELFASIRDAYFVVSIADLEPGKEWIIGPQLKADHTLHAGELPFEGLAALISTADLVWTSGGFATILAPAVGTPVVSVLGGYEPASWLSAGAKFAPYLGIEPVNPCSCGSSMCHRRCTKALDVPLAKQRLHEFVSGLGVSPPAESRPITEMFTPGATPPPPPGQYHMGARRAVQVSHRFR